MGYLFGDVLLDTERYELRRAGVCIPLRRKAFQLLVYLLTHRDRVVTKDELLGHVWPGQYLGDAVLKASIMAVRKAVGDTGRTQRIIQTLHGYGYRFVAPVTLGEQLPPDSTLLAAGSRAPAPAGAHARLTSALLAQEHKQVTVLCWTLADAAARTTSLAPEVLHTVMHEVLALAQRTVQRYGGVMMPSMGEGFMALFGAPVAHEDHARRAVRAALELRDGLRAAHSALPLIPGTALTACIGLHTGSVVIGSLASDPPQLQTAVGATIHLATRLLHLAAPGTVVLSETTYRLLQDEVQSAVCGTLTVTEDTAAVTAYAVQGLTRHHTGVVGYGVRQRSRFVGRTQELTMLHERLAYAVQGQGQVVGIVGEAGMGKSRLLQEFARCLTGQPVTYREGHCLSYGSATPYGPVRDLLEQSCGLTAADPPEVIAAKVHAYVQAAGVTSEEDPLLLLQLLDVPSAAERMAHLPPAAQRARTFALLRQLFLHDSRRQPLVLAVENSHWIDATSEEWFATLIERLPGAPLLLLVTYRPGYRPPWLQHSATTQMALPALLPADSLAVVHSVAQQTPLADHLAQTIVAKAGGNPFFLEELTWAAVERGAQVARQAVPDTIQAVLATRIDRLLPGDKDVLQTAAVIGKDVSFPLLHAVTAMPEATLHDSLGRLQTSEFLYETQTMPALAYTFKHALTREVAYQGVLTSARQQLHRCIAQVIEAQFGEIAATQPAVLAQHYTEGGLAVQAIPYWQQAGQQALQCSANLEAVQHLTQGLELLATLPETPARVQQELDLQITLGPALIATMGYAAPAVEQTYARARLLCAQMGETPQLVPILQGLCQFYYGQGALPTARELGEQLDGLAQRMAVPAHRLEAHEALGRNLFFLGEYATARTHLEQGIALIDLAAERALALHHGVAPGVRCLASAALTLWCLGYPAQAVQRSQEALALAQTLTHPYSLASARHWAAYVHQRRREAPAVQAQAEALLTLATAQGFPLMVGDGTCWRGWALAMQGQGEAGLTQLHQGMAAILATGRTVSRPFCLVLLAEVAGHAGQATEGLRLLAEARAAFEASGRGDLLAEVYRLQGMFLLRQTIPDAARAETCFHQALAVARRQQAKAWELRAATSLSRLWQQQGKRHEARALLAPVYGWFTEGFDTVDLQEARALLEALGSSNREGASRP
jgi:class 3 adenylate cyclase/predicted ATPase